MSESPSFIFGINLKYGLMVRGSFLGKIVKYVTMDTLSDSFPLGRIPSYRHTGIILGLFFCLLLVRQCELGASQVAPTIAIDLGVIAQIESSNNPSAISKDGSYGLHQVTKWVVADYNLRHNAKYSLTDALDATVSAELASWYLHSEIPRLLRHFRKPVTVENVIIAYNCGISCVVKGRVPPITKRYLAKYRKLSVLSGVQGGLIYPSDNPADHKYRVSPQFPTKTASQLKELKNANPPVPVFNV